MSLKTRVLPTFTAGYNLVPNGTKGGPSQWTFTETLEHQSQRCHLGIRWSKSILAYSNIHSNQARHWQVDLSLGFTK